MPSLWVSLKQVRWNLVLFLNNLNAFHQMKSFTPKIRGDKKLHKESHTENTRFGMGDYYGTGIKSKMGRVRSDSVGYRPVSRKQMGTPPKSVV
jgi:hypothetical protein